MTLTYRQTLPSVLEPVAPGMGDRNVSFLREEFVTVDPEEKKSHDKINTSSRNYNAF